MGTNEQIRTLTKVDLCYEKKLSKKKKKISIHTNGKL